MSEINADLRANTRKRIIPGRPSALQISTLLLRGHRLYVNDSSRQVEMVTKERLSSGGMKWSNCFQHKLCTSNDALNQALIDAHIRRDTVYLIVCVCSRSKRILGRRQAVLRCRLRWMLLPLSIGIQWLSSIPRTSKSIVVVVVGIEQKA